MYQFKMNLDPKLLKEQLEDLAEIADAVYEDKSHFSHRQDKSMTGVLNMLGYIRDAVEKTDAMKAADHKAESDFLKSRARPMTDSLAVLICEGFEEPENDAEFVRAWQWLIDTDIAWKLEGSFGRIANRMIEDNVCKPAPEKSRITVVPPQWLGDYRKIKN